MPPSGRRDGRVLEGGMGRSTAVDVRVALARQQASESGHWDSEDAADAVVPWSPRELVTAFGGLDLRDDLVAIPGEGEAVRRCLVLTVAAHLDVEGAGAGA